MATLIMSIREVSQLDDGCNGSHRFTGSECLATHGEPELRHRGECIQYHLFATNILETAKVRGIYCCYNINNVSVRLLVLREGHIYCVGAGT